MEVEQRRRSETHVVRVEEPCIDGDIFDDFFVNEDAEFAFVLSADARLKEF